jgi:hypothetical protein
MTRAGGIVGNANVFGYVRAMSSIPRGEQRGSPLVHSPIGAELYHGLTNSVNRTVFKLTSGLTGN